MKRLLLQAILSAALSLGFVPAEASPSYSTVPHGEFAGVEKADVPVGPAPEELYMQRLGLETPTSHIVLDQLVELSVDVLPLLTLLLAALIFLSGLDDAFVDAYYWLHGLWRRKTVIGAPGARFTLADLNDRPERSFAIIVPAWKEHDVIAAMIENNVATLNYQEYRFFCGVYPNDPATAREVDRMAERYPGIVTRVDVPHDGPTCKGDCLNHIVRHILAEERSTGKRFAGMVLHDCEDVIHPLELRLFNALIETADLIQLPVFSLERGWQEFTAGTYIDDFAESHGKDIAVREALVGVVPGAGVATCYSRRAIAALWACSAEEPFNTASLTEDYDLSFRLKSLGMSQTFAHYAVDAEALGAPAVRGKTASVIATHEYFPDKFKAAYRQRARWIIGIAFQGWKHMGWRGTAWERYFLWRDRKVLVMAPAGALAYPLVACLAVSAAFGSDELEVALQSMLTLPLVQGVLLINVGFMINRALQRIYFVGRYYGLKQGLLAVLRIPVNNLINLFAVSRAWRLFLNHAITGKKLAWDKTAHVYPTALTLGQTAATADATQ